MPGALVASTVWRSSGGTCGSRSKTSRTWSCSTRKRASSSGAVDVGSATCTPRASRKGWPSTKSVMRKRWTPWQIR